MCLAVFIPILIHQFTPHHTWDYTMPSTTILLVDDHAEFRRVVREFLNRLPNVNVVGEAEDGIEALREVERLRPDLVLMDITMPGMNGLDATRRIKESLPGTRVIVLSSHSGDVYRRAADDSHADGYIEKRAMKAGLSTLLSAEFPTRVRTAV